MKEKSTNSDVGMTHELIGRLEMERRDVAAHRSLHKRQWETELATMKTELHDRKADALAIMDVRRKAVDRLKGELGDGTLEEEEEMKRRKEMGDENKTISTT